MAEVRIAPTLFTARHFAIPLTLLYITKLYTVAPDIGGKGGSRTR
jgi:hypothetical protein